MEFRAPPIWLKDVVDDPRIATGEWTYFDQIIEINLWRADERVEIGKFCSIAKGVTIFGGGNHRMDRATTYPFRAVGIAPLNDDPDPAQGCPTRIGHDVWIGDGATIMAGSIIGHGAVIGARAVVAGIVPPYTIVAGNPARLIRMRFSRETIDQLLAEAWWDWPIERIRESVDYLYRLPESEREGRSSSLSKIIKRLRLG